MAMRVGVQSLEEFRYVEFGLVARSLLFGQARRTMGILLTAKLEHKP
jgi:hypothetical protein